MKEDILEQVVDQYLNLEGYFTVANVRYKPDRKDVGFVARQHSVTSDIDIAELTGQSEFMHCIACTHLVNPQYKTVWTENPAFQKRLTPHLNIITLSEMFTKIKDSLSTTPAGSDLGRLIQLMKAAGLI